MASGSVGPNVTGARGEGYREALRKALYEREVAGGLVTGPKLVIKVRDMELQSVGPAKRRQDQGESSGVGATRDADDQTFVCEDATGLPDVITGPGQDCSVSSATRQYKLFVSNVHGARSAHGSIVAPERGV
jgi:hypothetical protein